MIRVPRSVKLVVVAEFRETIQGDAAAPACQLSDFCVEREAMEPPPLVVAFRERREGSARNVPAQRSD